MSPTLRVILKPVLAVLIAFFIFSSAIRLVINPVYAAVEYHMPAFPEDPYGFNLDDRLYWSRYAIEYLTNAADISYLADLQFPEGGALYNERELSHMVDVKKLVQAMIIGWDVVAVVLIGLWVWAWRGKWLPFFIECLGTGGKAAIGLIVAILAGVAISFQWLFTLFHKLFFTGDSWLFYYSDTLIRLFPMRFWQDAFILVGVITLAIAVALILYARKPSKTAK